VTGRARAGTSAVVAMLGAAGLLLVLVTWAASIGPSGVMYTGHAQSVEPNRPVPTTGVVHGRTRLDEIDQSGGQSPPDWLTVVAVVLVMLPVLGLVAVGIWLLGRIRPWWRARTTRGQDQREEEGHEPRNPAVRVAAAISGDADDQRHLLARGGEPRNAIVASWHQLERQAMRAGVERRPWLTTSEFVPEVLHLVGADPGAVSRLADLYREARFSDHSMTDAHRRQALEALDAIHHSVRVRERPAILPRTS
jgi:hypothetical protein